MITTVLNQSTDTLASPIFHVGGIPIYGETILSPMDGVSDWPFRSLCRREGSAMSYTEFVRAEDVLEGRKSVFKKLTYDESERPVAFQIYGDDPDEILEAALRIRELEPDTIDLNMGCPAKSVANRGAGVGMMRTPLKIARTLRKLTAALDIPVTGKMRLGWTDCQTYKLVARIVEGEGGALIALHGRTKEQGYGGTADWDAIAKIKAAVKIPVIGNGDVRTVADIKRMQDYTGCEAVMIGREAMANPWIFSGRDRYQVPSEEVRGFMREHLKRNIEFYGEEDGQRLFRKYVAQYLMMKRLTREERRNILSKKPPEEFLAVLDEVALTLAEIRT
ncbi:MAG: tRNA-dihydrouridine synthase family protein [Anaerolineales bacterium]